MTRMVKAVSDMDFDEVSLVDRPAVPHARVALAKRHDLEDSVGDYFDQDGDVVDINDLEAGDIVADENGQLFEWVEDPDDEDETAPAAERELETVGKNFPGAVFGREPLSKSTEATIREELRKAQTEGDRDAVIAKAFGEITKAEQRANEAEAIAKSEQTLRLTREYISKAAEYNVPIPAEELGPVLLGMAVAEFDGQLPTGSCAVIHKALCASGEMLYTEAGFDGQADNLDPFDQVEAYLESEVAKAARGGAEVSKAQATTNFFESNPRAYDDYVAGLGR